MLFVITPNNRGAAKAKIDACDPLRHWDMTLAEHKSKRSLEQNSWARKFARDFGLHFGYEADEAYDLIMYKCNPVFIVDKETGEELRMPGSFSKKEDGTPRNTKEAAEIQETILRYAESLGFIWDGV